MPRNVILHEKLLTNMTLFEKFCVSRSKFEGANAQTPRLRRKATEHGSVFFGVWAGRVWDFPTVTPLVFAATVSKTH